MASAFQEPERTAPTRLVDDAERLVDRAPRDRGNRVGRDRDPPEIALAERDRPLLHGRLAESIEASPSLAAAQRHGAGFAGREANGGILKEGVRATAQTALVTLPALRQRVQT